MPLPTAKVSQKGADRWARGHPWIYRSDLLASPDSAGLCHVRDRRGKFLGVALYSPKSEIRLRLLSHEDCDIDLLWWRKRLAACLAARSAVDASAYRLVHGEGDGLPSLVVDRYDRWLVVQLLSAGIETQRSLILDALAGLLEPEGILLRNDVGVRTREGLPQEISLALGSVPDDIEVREGRIRYLAAPWSGQKTGAFLDQRSNRLLAGRLVRSGGSALDCFAYHGSFALHLAERADRVTAVDQSADALARGAHNAALNGFANIDWLEADAFEVLRRFERERRRFDTIVVDPPAFAKTKTALAGALRGYKEINLRAMRLLAPGGFLVTASCSFHLGRAAFLDMLADAASDSGRRLILANLLGQGEDHPELLSVPETGYLKGAVLHSPV